jgi:hypothetical protein
VCGIRLIGGSVPDDPEPQTSWQARRHKAAKQPEFQEVTNITGIAVLHRLTVMRRNALCPLGPSPDSCAASVQRRGGKRTCASCLFARADCDPVPLGRAGVGGCFRQNLRTRVWAAARLIQAQEAQAVVLAEVFVVLEIQGG